MKKKKGIFPNKIILNPIVIIGDKVELVYWCNKHLKDFNTIIPEIGTYGVIVDNTHSVRKDLPVVKWHGKVTENYLYPDDKYIKII